VIEDLNCNVYRRSLVGAMVEQKLFEKLVLSRHPRLFAHLQSCGFDLALATNSWWLTLFIGGKKSKKLKSFRVVTPFFFCRCSVVLRLSVDCFGCVF
jgi:hypothetical protein